MTTKTLSLAIDPSGTETGGRVVKRMIEDVAAAAVKAERSVDSLSEKSGRAMRVVGANAQDASRGMKSFQASTEDVGRAYAAMTTNMARTASIASFQQRNLAFQLNDVFQSVALGMPAMQILLQQGPQIAQIYGASEGGIGRAFKETATLAMGLVARLWPVAAAAAGVYGAYKLVTSYSAEARLQVDDLTRSMAAQAQSAGALKGSITDFAVLREGLVEAMGVKGALGELITLQGNYSTAIGESAGIQTRTSSSIVSDLRREYDAKRSLLEIESRLQDAKIAVQKADIATKQAQLRKEIGDQVFTRSDLEAQGFSDPRTGRFTQLPDSITGLEKLNSVIANNPLSIEIAKASAELALSETQAQKLKDTLAQTFGGAAVSAGLDRLSALGSTFAATTQSANALGVAMNGVGTAVQTSLGGVSAAAQAANTGVVNVTQQLAKARMQQLSAYQQATGQISTMKQELADVQATLANAAKINPQELFGRSAVTGAAEAIGNASMEVQEAMAKLSAGTTSVKLAHEAIERARSSLIKMGADSKAVDAFINAMVAGYMRTMDLKTAIDQVSRSIMNIPNRVVSIGIQQYTVGASGGGTKGVNVYGGQADMSYQQYSVGGKTIGVSSGNGAAVRPPVGLVTQDEIDTMLNLQGRRAAGGPVSAGGTYLVGEKGPEILKMQGGGHVTNANSTAAILSGGRDTLSLIEDHLFNAVQELRIHTNYFETFESDFGEMIACLKKLESSAGRASSSYSGSGSSYSSGSSYGGSSGSSDSGQSHLDPYSPYYFNPARNNAGRGGGRYDPVADALMNGNTGALRNLGGGPTEALSRALGAISGSGGPSLLDRLKRQAGFATGGQIMPGEDQRVEFFKKNSERVIIVDDKKVSDGRGGNSQQSRQDTRPIQITNHFNGGNVGDPRSRQAMADDIRRTVLQVIQGRP